jgi:prepilin signal peptidase PulO-like enzyme (type II secretory pathway)
MIAEVLVLFALPLVLALAAGWDLASFTIPNFLSLALLGLFAVFALVAGLSLPAIGWHLLAGFAGLFIGFTLYAAGQCVRRLPHSGPAADAAMAAAIAADTPGLDHAPARCAFGHSVWGGAGGGGLHPSAEHRDIPAGSGGLTKA